MLSQQICDEREEGRRARYEGERTRTGEGGGKETEDDETRGEEARENAREENSVGGKAGNARIGPGGD